MTDSTLARAAARQPIVLRFPAILVFMIVLAVFTVGVTILSEGFGIGVISTSFVKTLGKTLCLCLVALAMDLVWGYCGILSLGHMAFFALGGYAIGMWLMYERTRLIVVDSLAAEVLPPRPSRYPTASPHRSSAWWARPSSHLSGLSPIPCRCNWPPSCWCRGSWRWSLAGSPFAAA